jgi:truncated hemoglobin YjbI
MGGEETISKVVDEFYNKVLADETVNLSSDDDIRKVADKVNSLRDDILHK